MKVAVATGVFPYYHRNDDNNDNSHNNNNHNVVDVSREAFLDLLRRNVKIDVDCRIVQIGRQETIINKSENDGGIDGQQEETITSIGRLFKYYVIAEDGREYGDFDVVVLANGLFGEQQILLRNTNTNTNNNHMMVAKIGDCYWYSQRLIWWDFGMTRIHQGADIAIRNAMDLGGQLLIPMTTSWRDEGDIMLQLHQLGSLAVSTVSPSSSRHVRQKVILVVLIFPVLVAIIFRIIK
jgi:hypothetical protein